MRLIDADALKTAVDGEWCPDMMVSEIWDVIDNAPTVATDTNVLGKWISVKYKKRPHICSLVLAVWENAYGFQKVRMIAYDKYKGEEIWSDRPDGYHITHWMPLPEPPQEVSEDD